MKFTSYFCQSRSKRETNKNQSKEAQFLKARKDPKLSHAPEGPINSLVAGQLGRLNAPNGTLHKFIAKEIAMNTADDDPSLIRQKILRHAHAVSLVDSRALFASHNQIKLGTVIVVQLRLIHRI